MSLHAKLSPEAQAALMRQKRVSTIASIVVSTLMILLIGLVLGLFLLDAYVRDAPTFVTYQTMLQEDQEPETRRLATQLTRQPASPSSTQVKVIAANMAAPTAIPVPDVAVTEPSAHFGMDMDFGQGWDSDAMAMGGGGRFGSTSSASGGLPGYLYDLKQDSRGNPRSISGRSDFAQHMVRVQRSNFSEREFSRHFKNPVRLYLTRLAIPTVNANLGPQLFQAEGTVEPTNWVAHYSGRVVAPRNMTFRFVGLADDYLSVFVNNEPKLHASLPNLRREVSDGWSMPEQPGVFPAPGTRGNSRPFVFGDWITVRSGQEMHLDIAVGEQPGGVMQALLMVEEQGVEYRKASNGRPILPLFTTAPILPDEIEELKKEFRSFQMEFDYAKTPLFLLRQ